MSSEISSETLLKSAQASLSSGEPAQAAAVFEQVLARRPTNSAAWRGLGKAQLELGQDEQARQSFARALEILPYDRYAAHMHAALSGNAGLPGYVAELFDSYADQFDSHLTDTLGYRIPQSLATMLADRGPFGALLDLGCGTGLVGVALAHLVSTMDGIDIAPRMTRKAHERDLYRHLRTGDTLDSLVSDPALAGPYDLVTAADVFVYVGPLEPTFAAVARAMAPGGIFAFSTEDGDSQDIVLRSSGRYAHAPQYITRLAQQSGFSVDTQLAHSIRHEREQPIAGHIHLLTRNP